MTRRALTFTALAAFSAVALAGCGGGGGDDGPTEPANRAPDVSITRPAEGSSFQEGETVVFEGSAVDPEQGSLTGSALVWSSDLDGRLGTGTRVETSALSAGDHTVTLEATDAEGATGSDRVSLAVTSGEPANRADLRSGLLAALPGGALVDETVDVEARIENVGSVGAGPFDWEITLDGSRVASGRVDTLAAGDSVNLPRAEGLGPLTRGNHTVRLEIDTGDEVPEESEGNNPAEQLLPVYVEGMDIELRFLSDVSEDDSAAFRDAADRWETLVPPELRDVRADSLDTSQCVEGGPTLNETIDDLLILVRVDSIDGTDGVLAEAGPCFIRSPTPPKNVVIGALTADSADIENQRQAGNLQELLVHEIAHVLGFGTLWSSDIRDLDLVAGADTETPYYTGRQAREAFVEVGGDTFDGQPVPVEDQGDVGTALSHWREDAFQNELMTGFIQITGDNPLSIVSVEAMGDLLLATNPDAADAYVFPGGATGSAVAGLRVGGGWERRLPAPLFGIDPATGRVELLQPVRRP